MARHPHRVALAALLLGLAAGPAGAQSEADRLRDALRQAVAGLQSLQQQNVQLQARAAQAEADANARAAEVRRLGGQLEQTRRALTALGEEQEATKASLAETGRALDASTRELASTRQTLARTQVTLRETEARRADSEVRAERENGARLACEDTNRRLHDLGRAILAAYVAKGPLTALAQREPVTGLMQVQIENIVQDYEDRLRELRLRP